MLSGKTRCVGAGESYGGLLVLLQRQRGCRRSAGSSNAALLNSAAFWKAFALSVSGVGIHMSFREETESDAALNMTQHFHLFNLAVFFRLMFPRQNFRVKTQKRVGGGDFRHDDKRQLSSCE